MSLKTNRAHSSHKMKKLTVVLTDCMASGTLTINPDQSEKIEKEIESSDKRKRSVDTCLRCHYCAHDAKNWDELLEHLQSYRQCFDHYRAKARKICPICDKPFKQVRKHIYDVIKGGGKLDNEKHDLHEKFFALFFSDDKKKKSAKKRYIYEYHDSYPSRSLAPSVAPQ